MPRSGGDVIIRAKNSKCFSAEIALGYQVEQVMPLLCPVKERDWVPGWEPLMLWSDSGVIETGCTYTTVDPLGVAIWQVLHYRPELGQIELMKVVADQVLTHIQLDVVSAPRGCKLKLNYRYTAVGDRGINYLRRFDDLKWQQFVERWQQGIERYLNSHCENASAI